MAKDKTLGKIKRELNLIKARGFDKNPQNINKKGRPRRMLSDIIAEMKAQGVQRVGPSQVADAYEILLNLSQDELVAKAMDKEAPMIMRIVAKAMLSSKGFDIIERMIDRVHGKATQPTEVNLSGNGAVIRITTKK
jgi:hypothetical protein